MLVSAISNLANARVVAPNLKNTNSQNKPANYEHLNYFGSKETVNKISTEEMFHKIALWKEFCEKNIINDESQKESFNYLA